jgi:hypothetical protein
MCRGHAYTKMLKHLVVVSSTVEVTRQTLHAFDITMCPRVVRALPDLVLVMAERLEHRKE